jgi:hypothetical protein
MALFQVVNGGGGPGGLWGVRSSLRTCAVEIGWTALAEEVGVPTTTLWRFCHDGYEPRKPSIRMALGLPVDPIVLAAPRVCACGCGISYVPIVPHQVRLPGHPRRREARRAETTRAR